MGQRFERGVMMQSRSVLFLSLSINEFTKWDGASPLGSEVGNFSVVEYQADTSGAVTATATVASPNNSAMVLAHTFSDLMSTTEGLAIDSFGNVYLEPASIDESRVIDPATVRVLVLAPASGTPMTPTTT
jgi:hypothetical protein